MSVSLEGKHAIVTGGSRGIGLACARALREEGARITIAGRDRATLDAAVEALGGREVAFGVTLDVSDPKQVRDGFEAARAGFGPALVLVNNAGIAPSAPFLRTDLTLWNEVLGTDLTGAYLCTREALPAMVSAGWGRVINVASTAGLAGYPYVTAYCAAKHGLVGLTRALALEVATQGVTVNAVCPGFTDTAIVDDSARRIAEKSGKSVAQIKQHLASRNPQGRLVMPDEVAGLVRYLCTSAAAAINGAALPISGGEL